MRNAFLAAIALLLPTPVSEANDLLPTPKFYVEGVRVEPSCEDLKLGLTYLAEVVGSVINRGRDRDCRLGDRECLGETYVFLETSRLYRAFKTAYDKQCREL